MNKLFRCPKCKVKAISIFRYESMLPLGLCGHCKCVTELRTEDLITMIKRICDMPKCNNEILDGQRKVITITVSEVSDNDEPTSTEFEVMWDICDECIEVIKHMFTDPDGLDPIYRSAKVSKGMKKSWARRKTESIIVDSTDDDLQDENIDEPENTEDTKPQDEEDTIA